MARGARYLPLATMNLILSYFQKTSRRKIEPKEITSCLIRHQFGGEENVAIWVIGIRV